MSSKKRFAINVVTNWVAMAVGMVVPFFLAPFVVRHLGATIYGIWILAVSTAGYLNMLDLGLRSAITRFVSKSATEGDTQAAQKAIAATLWFRGLIAAVMVIISIALSVWFGAIFKIPHDLVRPAQITVLLCALGVASTLVAGVYGGVLRAINRFDVLSSITMTQTLVRAVGVILILRSGHGLVVLAVWEFIIVFLSAISEFVFALRLYPPCRIFVFRPDMKTLKSIWSYSFKTFIIIIAVHVIFYTDNIVVAAFLNVSIVAFYSIAGSLAMYSGQISTAMGTTFIPIASGLDASGNSDSLKKLLTRGTQAMLGLMMPIGLTLALRGKTFIGLWMGPQFSEISGTILQILMISQFFTIGNSTASQIAFGVDKHRLVAKWSAIEAVFNLSLSLVLVKTIGLYGVAWGTSISMAVIHLIFWPRFVKKEFGVSPGTYLWEGWGKVVLCSIPFAVVSLLVDRRVHPHSLVAFFAEVLMTLPIYLLAVLAIFHKQVFSAFKRWQASRRPVLQGTV
ncbi:polysaccharide biosynthesis C-terminal domain-containing protein [Tunturiibacter empetritectus]|uniref:O-antigen/teichoic acid export membrane protein n=2 Tax=Tunturiibacter TaxID=3154218 RepID=A0A852VDI2_9BACT|nr:polysaccharide biosynthesis C-terminal domain-containing protein [Edaphobacter lichenicola]NYF90948.1 O-antigen/teichoic acid export membrane protein [Edaphobacter lichenicola]